MQTATELVGIWTLISCVAIKEDGRIEHPYGDDPVGQLFYDENGNMMVAIMRPGIEKFASADLFQGTAEEILPAFNGFIAYYGTYRVVPGSGLVIHHLKACSFPNWVQQDQTRYYELRNGQLILRTPSIGTERYELTWMRIK